MTNGKIQLSVIVLFYLGERWIKKCIRSLEDQSLSRDSYEIIMVDNGGSTPSVRKYNGKPNLKVLHYPKNEGFAGGNNRSITFAEGDLILLMNQDVVVHFRCLEALISAFATYPQAGVVSTNMLMVSAASSIDRYALIDNTVGLYRLTAFGYASYFTTDESREMIPVEFVSGNGLCFRKEILNDVGRYLFDHRLISYAEDLDFSIRLKKTKWKMYVQPKAVVYHYRDDAYSGKPVDKLRKLIHVSSNRLLVYYNNFTLGRFLLKLPALLLGIPLKVLRPDGADNLSLLNFMAASTMVPVIFINFCLRLLRLPKREQ